MTERILSYNIHFLVRTQSSQSIIMVYMFNHWLSKYYVNDFSWDTFPQKV